MAVRYTLRYREASETVPNPNAWTEITDLTSTSQAVTGLSAGTEYEVEVVAISDGGVESTPVSGGRWTLFGQPSAPSATPAGYALTSGDDGTNGAIDVEWTEVTGATSYTVSHRETGQGDASWVEVTGLSGTSTRLEGLNGATTHEVRVAVVNGDSVASTPSTATTGVSAAVASGGTVTVDGTSVLHEFAGTGAGTLTLRRGREISYLVVGGGGGGGGDGGGGGGGGAIRESTHDFAGATSIALVVGGGGEAGAWGGPAATAGSPSTITLAGTTYTVPGGSAGSGSPGGLGGAGGTGDDFTESGATGGAGSTSGDTSGNNGGDGPTSSITGSAVRYGGGGGGGIWFNSKARYVGGSGGDGGGGAAAIINNDEKEEDAFPGDPGTGGGGGAGTASYLGENVGDGTGYRLPGAAGGSGVVIVRYDLPA